MISVLYVDDEPDLLEIAKVFLEESGDFRVTTAVSAQEALASYGLLEYDAIISDYLMPGMDGIAFLKAVRQRSAEIPFILFTGRGREEVVVAAIDNGADFYLQKGGDPCSQFAELSHKIRQAAGRRRAERERSESEKRLLDIISFLPDATLAIDRAGTVIAWNRAMEEMTGKAAAGIIGRGQEVYQSAFYQNARPMLIDLVLVPDEVREKELYLYTKRDGTTLTAETILTMPGRPPVYLWGKACRLYDENGNLIGAIESVRDITDRKTAEIALKESEERYRTIVNDLAEMIIRFDPDGTITFANEACQAFFLSLLDLETLAGKNISGFSLPGKPGVRHDIDLGILARLTPENPSQETEHCVAGKDGQRHWQNWTIQALFGQDGRLSGYQAVGSDVTDRKRMEETLRVSEEKFRALVETSPDIVWEIDPQGVFRYLSPKIQEVLGYSPDELTGRPVYCLIPEDARPFVRDEIGKHAASRARLFTVEVPARHRDGRALVVEIRSSPVFSAGGTLLGMRGVARDITERKKTVDRLRLSEEMYRALVETSPDIIWEIDRQGRFLYISPTVETVMGYPPEEIVGRSIGDLVEDGARPYALQELARCLSSHGPFRPIEVPARHRDGHAISIEIRPTEVFGADGSLAGFRGTAHDITGRKQAQAALKESEQKFRDIFNNTNDGIQIIGLDDHYRPGRILDVNEVSCRMVQYSREELLQMESRDLDGGLRSKPDEQIAKEMKEQAASTFETRHTRKDGSRFFSEVSMHPAMLQGNLVAVAVVRDITDRKNAEEAAKKAHQQLTLLSGITRHDILNNITVMLGYLCFAKARRPCPPEMVAWIGKLEEKTNQIRDQIEFTRLYEQLGSTDPRWQDIHAVLAHAKVPGGITVAADDCDGVTVFADPMLRKVFENLIGNSVRHGERVTAIRVHAAENGNRLVIVYEDNGVGIPQDEKEKIFERGYGKNTGLGLFLVREVLALTGI